MALAKIPLALTQLVNVLIADLGFSPRTDEAEKIRMFALAAYALGIQEGKDILNRRDF